MSEFETTTSDVLEYFLPRYREQGFDVFVNPSPSILPSFMQGFRPDAVALRPDKKIAIKNKIPYQMEILPRGGTDAGGVQRLHGGIPAFTLSTPTRYIHTVNESVHKDDVQACIDLLAKYIEDAHNGNYSYD